MAAGVAEPLPDALDHAHCEPPPDQLVEVDAERHDVAPRLAGAELDAGLARERLDRLGLDQGEVLTELSVLEEGAFAREVPVTLEPAARNRLGRFDTASVALGLRGQEDRSDRRSHGSSRLQAVSRATLHTNAGPVTLEFFDEDAPKTVDNFRRLSSEGFYDGLKFHRVIKDFMIQGGCPQGTGTGGPGYTFDDEPNQHRVVRGALAMANSGPNTNGSQFFVVTAEECPWLDGKHTVFGRVVEGMDVVDKLESSDTDAQDRPRETQLIERVELDPA